MERPGAQEVMLIIMVRMAIARKKIRFMRFGIKIKKGGHSGRNAWISG
jgi:hypothetical protein